MTNHHQQATRTGQHDDPLRRIKGIGEKIADALHSIGIHSLAELAQTTQVDLARKLSAQPGLKLSSQWIEAQDWVSRARDLTADQTAAVDLPRESDRAEQSETEPAAIAKTTVPGWRQQAGFSLFFDYMLDERGEPHWQTRVWQTRVWHQESDQEELFPDIEPAPWVAWILQQADLLALAEATPIPPAKPAPAPLPATADTKLELIEPLVEVIEPGAEFKQRMLAVTTRFQLVGADAGALAASAAPYQAELHLIDADHGTTNLIFSQRGRLQPDTVDYASRQIVAIPANGDYEWQSIVFLLQPGEALAMHIGPTLRVVP